MRNLYLLTTLGLGDYYIVAENPKEAEDALMEIFKNQDYGFAKNRRVISIKWLSKELYPALNQEHFLSDNEARLLIIPASGSTNK